MRVLIQETFIYVTDARYPSYRMLSILIIIMYQLTIDIVRNVRTGLYLKSGNAIHVNLQVVYDMKEYFLKCAVRRM